MKFSFLLFTFLQAKPYNKPNYAKPFSFYVEKAGIPCRSPAGTNTGRLYFICFPAPDRYGRTKICNTDTLMIRRKSM